MAKFTITKRIVKEDFSSKYFDLLDKLLFPINNAFEQLSAALQTGLTFRENFVGIESDVEFTAPATVASPLSVKLGNTRTCRGITVIRVENLTDSIILPGAVGCQEFSVNGQVVNITNVTGVISGKKYRLKLQIQG